MTHDTAEKVARALWHRFGSPSVVEWEDETHRADYFDAAYHVLEIVKRGEEPPRTRDKSDWFPYPIKESDV